MNTNKLQSIIATKNERLEREALNEAEDIIGQIVFKQNLIIAAQADIERLRKHLKELQAEQLDSQTILGQE